MNPDFAVRTGEYRSRVEQFLAAWYERFHGEPQEKLFAAMEYSLLAGGKRLRPAFVFDFCRMCGSNWEKATPFAAAIEMIHTYSLIHDDLPCMDDDDYRRGRLTNHKVFGEAMAVLAGDALLTDAFRIASTAELSGSNVAKAIGVLAECAGSAGMVGGQVLDILSEERHLSEEEVLQIQSRKTGALIKAACTIGVLCGNGSSEQYAAAGTFAENLGLAFQIRDDMLDVIGTQEEMGKGVGTDDAKNTFVRLYGLERCEELVQKYTSAAIEALKAFDDNAYMVALANSLTVRRI